MKETTFAKILIMWILFSGSVIFIPGCSEKTTMNEKSKEDTVLPYVGPTDTIKIIHSDSTRIDSTKN